MRPRLICQLLLLLLTLRAHVAHADASSDKAAAQALFDEGRKLLSAGRFAEACAKLEASQRLDAGLGTQLNLADCYEKSGRTASAWAEFREASAAARHAGSKDREEVARKRAAALEDQLSYLTITLAPGQVATITRNGAPVDSALLGTPFPVDPGELTVSVNAAGKQPWSVSVHVAAQRDHATVSVPQLQDAPSSADDHQAAPPPEAAANAAHTSEPIPMHADRADRGSGQRILAITSGGLGIAGIAVGAVFGLNAAARWNEAQSACGDAPRGCNEQSRNDAHAASTNATISTVAWVVGGAGIAGALVLWLTAPSNESDAHTSLALRPDGVTLWGRF